MPTQVETMETSSRNKIYRAHMRNIFEGHSLQEKVDDLERSKVSLLENHLRRTLEVKDVIRTCRQTSGRSRQGLPSDGHTTGEMLHAPQTRATPWSYFGSATLDTWSGQPNTGPHHPHPHPVVKPAVAGRPQTADTLRLRRRNRKVHPTSQQTAVDDQTGTGSRDRPKTSLVKLSAGSASGFDLTDDDLTLPGTATASFVSEAGESTYNTSDMASLPVMIFRKVGEREQLKTNPEKPKSNSKSAAKQASPGMVTQLAQSKDARYVRSLSTGPGRRPTHRQRASEQLGGRASEQVTRRPDHVIRSSSPLGQSQVSLGAPTSLIPTTPRGRLDSEYSDVFFKDDATLGCESPFSEGSVLPAHRPLSRGDGMGIPVVKRPPPEKRAELIHILKLSEAPSSARGPRVTFDPSVKGTPDRIRLGPKVRVTVDSDSESDVDLSKMEKRHFDPTSALSPRRSAKRKKVKPELQFYVRPQERHRTENLFMMKKMSMLQRHLKVAKEPPPGGMSGGLRVEVNASTSHTSRGRALEDLVADHVRAVTTEAKQRRLTQCLSIQAKVGSFLKSISHYITAQA